MSIPSDNTTIVDDEDLDGDPDVHAIVLTGASPAFCTGLDLTDSAPPTADSTSAPRCDGSVNAPWEPIDTPAIGAIDGPAVTGGLEVPLACDIFLRSRRTSFADTHARVGVMPGWGLSVLLPATVGRFVARRMRPASGYMLADEALTRLLPQVASDDDPFTAAVAPAEPIANNNPRTMKSYLAFYRGIEVESLGSGCAVEAATSAFWAGYVDPDGVAERCRRVIDRGRRQTSDTFSTLRTDVS